MKLLAKTSETKQVGLKMHQLMSRLYPICRSITGDGVRETLRIIKENIPITIHEIASNTSVFDWTIPKEWNIKDAYVKNSSGEKIIDFNQSNLHVLNYSTPVHKKVNLSELKQHLFTLPEQPSRIPYRTSYYQENWGFCLSHNQYQALQEDEYEIFIDSSLENGRLSYGEYLLKGKTDNEILISTHICHPSLCNDNLSGIVVTTFLAQILQKANLQYSYRFLFIPGTIGSICWLSTNEKKLHRIKHGLVITGVGDAGKFTYKKSRQGDYEIDRVAQNVLKRSGHKHQVIDFFPYGYDERQFCSPGFNLPVGCFMRTPHGQYPEYHTSADNLNFVQPQALAESLQTISIIMDTLENNKTYLNLNPHCEPQLGKRGLYHHIGGHENSDDFRMAILWVLNLSDGRHSLLDITERSDLNFELIKEAARLLKQNKLLHDQSEQ